MSRFVVDEHGVEWEDRDATPDLDPDVATFLAEPDPEHDWQVPGVIERGDRVIVTGPEGGGKSTYLRQLAVQMAAGIHPFTLDAIDPVNVLLVDLENSRRHVRRKLRPLVAQAGAWLDPTRLRVVCRPEGVNLLGVDDAQWLEERIAVNRPDVVIGGPLYKLHDGDPIEERPAKSVARFIDYLRVEYGVTFIIEAHSPYAANGGKRPGRPYGASLWSRWPEFGLHLSEKGIVTHWRGQRDERDWPAVLSRGGEWPWMAEADTRTVLWARIVAEVTEHGDLLSERTLAAVLGTSQASVHRAIRAHETEWHTLAAERKQSA